MNYYLTILIYIGINSILALSLNIIVGYAGQISLGHAAFYGIGAYSSALIATKLGVSFWVSLPLAIIITAVVGAILGLPSLRVSEDFLAITTIGINFVVQAVFKYVKFFGGALGVSGIPFPSIGGHRFSLAAFALMTAIFTVISAVVAHLINTSWIGLGLKAVREDELAASSSGVNVYKFKVLAFVLGSALAGLAGSLYAHFMMFITADDFGFPLSIAILSMIVIGGIGTVRGAFLGALLLTIMPELFRPLSDYRMLVYAILLILFMRFLPEGLIGDESIVWKKIRGKA